jgi:glucose/arabinose dehydrogenase
MIISGGNGSQYLVGTADADVVFGHGSADVDPLSGSIAVTRVATGLDSAVLATFAPGDADGLYIVEKDEGRIVRLDLGTGTTSTFLDLPPGVLGTGGEEGLLSLAFHPDYQSNGRFFLHLVNAAGNIEVRAYLRSTVDPLVADPASEAAVLTIPHPTYTNHNGGTLAFGPDGLLYISIGDGGGADDPHGNGQDIDSLLGKILRIDVDGDDFVGDATRNYAIPNDNPFVGIAGADEIFDLGLRNPWRMSFDAATGDLWIADVGQDRLEEVDVHWAGVPGGLNFGWSVKEGTLVNGPGSTAGLTDPVFEYGHDTGRSITGGLVYRGPSPGLQGAYVFADFIAGTISALIDDGSGLVAHDLTANLVGPVLPYGLYTSFGTDSTGRLYVVSITGDVFRLDPTAAAADGSDIILGGAGDDQLYGGAGNDVLLGQAGADALHGGLGRDTASYADALSGVIASLADGGSGGEAAGDTYVGIESLVGSAHADRLVGDDAANGIAGGRGKDVVTGGLGADTFDFNSPLEVGKGASRDRIDDFQRGVDRIDFGDIDARSGVAGNQRFTFIGERDFTGKKGELHYVDRAGYVLVEGDVNGDGRADLQIRIDDIARLSKADFIL